MLNTKTIVDTVQGKIIYMLILVILVQFLYPITLRGGIYLIVYQIFYAAMFAGGMYLGSESRRFLIVTGTLALLFLGFGISFALDPENSWKLLVTYIVLAPYLAMVTFVLLRYIFVSQHVTRDVLCAATAVYLLLGAVFVPIYGILETINPGSFVDGAAAGAPVAWQTLIYYSYTTLTTVGYGDVLPVSPWARTIANIEGIIGVMFIAVMMARLVSLYSAPDDA